MNAEDQYLKFVRWSDEDHAYVGFCPDLFPWGGVCHGKHEQQTYRRLCELVHAEIEELQSAHTELPVPTTRPMRALERYREILNLKLVPAPKSAIDHSTPAA